jgi:hypothetical protein
MNNVNFGLITPSYAPDFARCQLLCQSVERFVSPPFTHYVIVDQRDVQLFSQLANQNTKILTVEAILPWWIKRVPFIKKSWLSLKTIPIRNWLVQQIVKLATAQQIDEDVSVFVDSDVTFVRPFNLESLTRDDQIRLFRDPNGNDVQRNMHFKWHEAASRLLGLPDVDMTIPDYIGNIITWKRENVVQLCQHLEKVSGRGWIETLANSWHLSEYILYGIFIDRILKEQSGHYYEPENICHDYWYTQPLPDEQLQNFFGEIRPEHVAVMISAKSGMPVERYKPFLETTFSLT